MDMQLQMRRNVDEMHASIGDLSAWTSEIGKRDRSLRPGTAGSQAATQAATDAARQEEEEEDAREIAAAKEELRRLYGEEQSTDPAPRSEPVKGSIGQKYDKWNHFNAEGVIKQLEESEADKERLRLEVARLENRRARRAQQEKHEADAREAEVLRQQGNDAFAAGCDRPERRVRAGERLHLDDDAGLLSSHTLVADTTQGVLADEVDGTVDGDQSVEAELEGIRVDGGVGVVAEHGTDG